MFIVIDGPDGVGKTTVCKSLVEKLNLLHMPAIYTSEPTKSEIGVQIRHILATGENTHLLTELFLRDRALHVDEISLLEKQSIVVCDRYKYSTVCYQHIQGEDLSMLIDKNRDFKKPDYAFILLAQDVDSLLSRINSRGENMDFFETKSALSKITRLYCKMSDYFPAENIINISFGKSADLIVDEILQFLV